MEEREAGRLLNESPGGSEYPSSRKTGEIAGAVVEDVQRLVTLQVALAKQELKEMAVTNAVGAGSISGAGLLVVIAVLAGIPVLIVELVPWHWAAALVWIVLYLLIAAGLALFGKARIRLQAPPKTVESMKENKEWALRRMKSAGS